MEKNKIKIQTAVVPNAERLFLGVACESCRRRFNKLCLSLRSVSVTCAGRWRVTYICARLRSEKKARLRIRVMLLLWEISLRHRDQASVISRQINRSQGRLAYQGSRQGIAFSFFFSFESAGRNVRSDTESLCFLLVKKKKKKKRKSN